MLNVQVQYLSHLENVKHNRAMEDIGYKTLQETVRHDYVVEDQGQQNINESIRTHKANEAISLMNAQAALKNAETNRMLANAQIPLIQSQTLKTGYEATLTRLKSQEQAHYTYNAQMMSDYKLQEQAARTQIAQQENEWYYSQALVGNISAFIPLAKGLTK